MTKEELEKEAEEYFKSICGDYNEEYERTGKRHYFVGFDIKNAYLASAEPREKRIAELIALINAERERQEKCDDVHLRKIADLEKENAKLKDGIALKDEEIGCIETDFNTFKSEAKEIIREFVEWATWQGSNCPNFKSIQDKAEAFLNSEVEK